MEFDVFIAHGPCLDGQTALMVAWLKLPKMTREYLSQYGSLYANKSSEVDARGASILSPAGALKIVKEWKLKGAKPQVFALTMPGIELPDELIRGKLVLVMDLDPGFRVVKQLIASTVYTLLVDHHASFEATLKEAYAEMEPDAHAEDSKLSPAPKRGQLTSLTTTFNYVWDPAKTSSGASLAWQLLYPETPIPPFIRLVQIQDTWNWEQEPELKAKECMAAIKERGYFNCFDSLAYACNNFTVLFPDLVKEGTPIVATETRLIKQIARRAELGHVISGGVRYNILYCNTPVFGDDVCHEMRAFGGAHWERCGVKIHFCAIWTYMPHTKQPSLVKVSLRSPLPGLKLGQIARQMYGARPPGGGGHDEAAAFVFEGLENFHKVILHKDIGEAGSPQARRTVSSPHVHTPRGTFSSPRGPIVTTFLLQHKPEGLPLPVLPEEKPREVLPLPIEEEIPVLALEPTIPLLQLVIPVRTVSGPGPKVALRGPVNYARAASGPTVGKASSPQRGFAVSFSP
ncbi:Hypothetical protein POVN_LOCUS714 [uncultured virus]|nr:Hypothetical protein POVN_LOCUS714 [uncultured virus]